MVIQMSLKLLSPTTMKLKWILAIFYLIQINIIHLNAFSIYPELDNFEPTGYYQPPQGITNLTTLVGKTVTFNCTLSNDQEQNLVKYSSSFGFKTRLNPTWLKADPFYDRFGCIKKFNTENIIVTRKGIIADKDHNKMKLISSYNDQFQSLQISNINIQNEGKYICREFNSQYDKLFYLNVYARVSGLSLQLNSPNKRHRSSFINSNTGNYDNNNILGHQMNYYTNTFKSNNNIHNDQDSGSISINENEILTINCTVKVSKPAANISIWLVPNHRIFSDKHSKKLSLYKFYTSKNSDFTLSSTGIAKLTVNRLDNKKSVVCVAENIALNEKTVSKQILNVIYAPLCSPYQKKVYHTGINQTLDLECRMTDANPEFLDFDWLFPNNQGHNDRSRSNGFISRVSFTPKKKSDFGEISCVASNGQNSGDCKMNLVLGGIPNPPHQCYHKENNKTIIIECLPGFDQGDPEVYFYLLKKKSNDVLVEYARKRDSCSFLISNLILEEHMNEFFVYSSNKYGNNREQATKIIIENREFLIKNSKKLQDINNKRNKRNTLIGVAILCGVVFFSIFCCMLMKCHNSNMKMKLYTQANRNSNTRNDSNKPQNQHTLEGYGDPFKYNSHQMQYSKNGVHIDNFNQSSKHASYKDKYLSNDTSSSDFDQETNYDREKLYNKGSLKKYAPSLINNIQDLDMSPKSKRLSIKEKAKLDSGCSRSFTEETTETDSDNYIKSDDMSILEHDLTGEQHKLQLYSPIKNHTISNTIKMNDFNNNHGITYTISSQKPTMKPTVWYGNHTDHTDMGINERNIYNVERGFGISEGQQGSTIEKIGYKHSFSNESSGLYNNHRDDNILYNDRDQGEDHNGYSNMDNNEYRNYSDLLIDNKDDFYNEDKEENKLFQWPQANLPQLYSNETISLDIDDDKIVGILV